MPSWNKMIYMAESKCAQIKVGRVRSKTIVNLPGIGKPYSWNKHENIWCLGRPVTLTYGIFPLRETLVKEKSKSSFQFILTSIFRFYELKCVLQFINPLVPRGLIGD